MRNIPRILNRALALSLSAGTLLSPHTARTQQASLSIDQSDIALCFGNITSWSLNKSVSSVTGPKGNQTVTWTVTATKGTVSGNRLMVGGYISVTNGGSADATIGNIVVNLQRTRDVGTPSKPKLIWASLSALVADATHGDAATTANIAAKASAEVPATSGGVYSVTGARGTFTENAISGQLQLLDVEANDIWALTPQQTIAPGQSVNLVFKANFDASLLDLGEDQALRTEVIVSFGRAGSRGNSGASAPNIDINGNGSIDDDESWVRSVPTRVTENIPAFEACHGEVTLDDTGVSATGSVAFGDFNVEDMPTEPITATSSFTVTATGVDGGASGGTISNTATLAAEGSEVALLVGYRTISDPVTGWPGPQPVYYLFNCCPSLSLSATATANIENPPGFAPGDFCTFSQGGLGGQGAPFYLLASHFATLFPDGLEVGLTGSVGYSMKFSSAPAVQEYLPAGGTPGRLTFDLLDPDSSAAGIFGGQALTLKLNIALSDAGVTPAGLGNLYYRNPGDPLHGLTVRQILAAAEAALGGAALPPGQTYSSLSTLCDHLNLSWHEMTSEGCAPSAWTLIYLGKAP